MSLQPQTRPRPPARTPGAGPPASPDVRLAADGALDIDSTANAIVARFRAHEVVAGVAALDRAGASASTTIRDALDRLVSVRSGVCWAVPAGAPPSTAVTLRRIAFAGARQPTMPPIAETARLRAHQLHDVYAAFVEVWGGPAAREALKRGDRVILGLRSERSTLSNRGRGEYGDRIVVLRRSSMRTAEEFARSNTQPTAQYDGNQQRIDAENRRRLRALHRPPPADAITFRQPNGDDANGDGVPDMGRLEEGTYELMQTTHHNPASAGTTFSLRPTAAAVAAGAGHVRRDTSRDGLFEASDAVADLNDTFKIHSGSRTNTDSAGCQTIHPDDFRRFEAAVSSAGQTRYQYVLKQVAP